MQNSCSGQAGHEDHYPTNRVTLFENRSRTVMISQTRIMTRYTSLLPTRDHLGVLDLLRNFLGRGCYRRSSVLGLNYNIEVKGEYQRKLRT